MTEELFLFLKQDPVRKKVTTLTQIIGVVITTDIDTFLTDSIYNKVAPVGLPYFLYSDRFFFEEKSVFSSGSTFYIS